MNEISRRRFLGIAAAAPLGWTLQSVPSILPAKFMYVGRARSTEDGEGLTVYRFQTGLWIRIQGRQDVAEARTLIDGYGQQSLYCFDGEAAVAFHADQGAGRVTYLNRQDFRAPASMCCDPTGRFLVLISRAGGVHVAPVTQRGAIEVVSAAQHTTVNPRDCRFDPTGRFVVITDAGTDQVLAFAFDPATGKLTPANTATHHGAQPNRVAFHPRLPYLYVANEGNGTLNVYAFDRNNGALDLVDETPSAPAESTAASAPLDVTIAPSGGFVYCSNSADSVGIFSVNQRNGTLDVVGWEPSRGRTPSTLTWDPPGEHLYVSNRDSNSIAIFRTDHQTGRMTPTGHSVAVSSPDRIVFRN